MLKRYDPCLFNFDEDDLFASMVEEVDGEYVKLADVEREMIPRPPEEESKGLLDDLMALVKRQQKKCRQHGLTPEIEAKKAALLRHLGVEVDSGK